MQMEDRQEPAGGGGPRRRLGRAGTSQLVRRLLSQRAPQDQAPVQGEALPQDEFPDMPELVADPPVREEVVRAPGDVVPLVHHNHPMDTIELMADDAQHQPTDDELHADEPGKSMYFYFSHIPLTMKQYRYL